MELLTIEKVRLGNESMFLSRTPYGAILEILDKRGARRTHKIDTTDLIALRHGDRVFLTLNGGMNEIIKVGPSYRCTLTINQAPSL